MGAAGFPEGRAFDQGRCPHAYHALAGFCPIMTGAPALQPGQCRVWSERERDCKSDDDHARSKLIDGAAFEPDALKAIGEAFDAAWAEIGGNFGNVPVDIDNARFRLANAVLSIASEDSRDVEVLKRAALQRMALDCRGIGR